jgi:hypothetical protein
MKALAAFTLLLALASPAVAHHVGAYTPRDNEITTNFKQIKFSLQAGKFDVALRLFDEGALRAAMRDKAGALPAGLESGTRAALQSKDAVEVERSLMIFFAALARELALEADRQLADPKLSRAARAATGQRFLEAMWRYYNLVDFAVSSRDNKSSTAVRLAFDEAEGYVKTTSASDADKLRAPLRRIAQVLSTLIDTSSALPRRDS